jgi:hypothetical protein
MRAAPHAGSRSSRRRQPHALPLLLAAGVTVALLACGSSPTVGSRAISSVARAAGSSPVAVPAPPFDDAGYWAYADHLQRRLDGMWDQRLGRYHTTGGGCESMINALMLLTHSVAAEHGHDGPARNDRRARLIARALVSSPAFLVQRPRHPRAGSHAHGPGWTNSMASGNGGQHEVFDAEIVDGLVHAWEARRALRLSASTSRLIAQRIHVTAESSFWRWPARALNQINWYALMYAADATVTSRRAALATPFRRQLDRFIAGVSRGRDGGPGNLGPGLRFHYLPDRPLNHPMNVDSSEYANIVLSFTRFYGQARRAGMPRPVRAQQALLRQWIKRTMAGYWTHSGYLNWDSGLGFQRWHQAKKLGLAQHALIGIAQSPELQPSPAWGRWAKWTLDRGLAWYARQPARVGGLPDPVFFQLSQVPQTVSSARLAAARVQANAARAVAAGLGRMRAAAPPPLYAYDPDTGRLAVTTPAYNTAIVPVNQHAFPYGGIELARLFDGGQRVAANIGGRGSAAFGVELRDTAGRVRLASQVARDDVDPRVTPLRLTHAPSGVGIRASNPAARAYAGTFNELRATGSVASTAARVISAHRFTARTIETRWTITRTGGSGPLSADVTFPSWGRRAQVFARLRNGARRRVGARPLALRGVASFEVAGRDSGYAIVPLTSPPGAVARTVWPGVQSSAPAPGPSLSVGLVRGRRFKRVCFAVRMIPGLSRTDPRG